MDRFYRKQFNTENLYSSVISIKESDLFVAADSDIIDRAKVELQHIRADLENYVAAHSVFGRSFTPVPVEPEAPEIVKRMAKSAYIYDIGPMAAVAGAAAGALGREFLDECSHLIIENGGDIFLKSCRPVTLSIYTGENSPFLGKLNFEIDPRGKPVGICTSSGTIGHSLSFGIADAVVAVCNEIETADVAATAIGNSVKRISDIERVMQREVERGVLRALIIVVEDRMAAWGDIKFV